MLTRSGRPAVSIIVPLYRECAVLPELMATLEPFVGLHEIVLVDDDGEEVARPEGGRVAQIEREIECGELGCFAADLQELREASRKRRPDEADRDDGSYDEQEELEHVGPDDGLDASRTRVENGEERDQENRRFELQLKEDRDGDGAARQADPAGKNPA